MDDRLRGLPFLRAIRLPEDKEEAWSVANLRCQIENRRVFASPPSDAFEYDDTSGTRSERASDPKGAVAELARALDENVWLVNGDAVAFVTADVPTPKPETLARAVLRAKEFAEPGSRTAPASSPRVEHFRKYQCSLGCACAPCRSCCRRSRTSHQTVPGSRSTPARAAHSVTPARPDVSAQLTGS